MTDLRVAVVDVYPVDLSRDGWKVLLCERSVGTRSPGAWEVVHGRIEEGETPVHAAVRELGEETGLAPKALYTIASHPFYVAALDSVLMAVTFAALVDPRATVTLGPEHSRFAWLSFADAADRSTWPRAEEHLRWIGKLLRSGTAGPAEDVLRVR